jgi:signal transduction histidine kinase
MFIILRSLKTMLTLVLLAMVLLPTLSIGWITHNLMSGYIRQDRISAVGRVATSKHEQLTLFLEHANHRAEYLLSDLKTQCTARPQCSAASLSAYLAAEGAIGASLQQGKDHLNIGVVQSDFRFKPGQLAKFFSTGANSDHAYVISVAKAGIRLSVSYPSATLAQVFNPPPEDLGLSGETFLTDGEGYFATNHRYVSTQGHQVPIASHPMQFCLSGKSGEMLDMDYHDTPIIHGYRFVPEFGNACIMAHITQEEAFVPLKLLQQRIFIAVALFCVVLFIATLYLVRRIVRPVIRLTQVARSIAEGDLRVQADQEGSNELAELARAFNYMTGRLHAAQEENRLVNAQLERRVEERTGQLESANQELESFNYSVAHDLRTPLRSIDGFSRVLSNKYRAQLDAQGLDYLDRVCRASQHMGRLIDDLLQLSKLACGPVRLEPVDLSEIARNVAEELKKTNPERQVCFTIASGLMVQADPGLLRIVLFNLLGNAWKFTGKRAAAEIEFGARDMQGERTFFVRDNGAGFNMRYVAKLFGAFQRLHTEHDFEGTGIGLATVQRIIQRHKGSVWAESTEGQGAIFYFTLPQYIKETE